MLEMTEYEIRRQNKYVESQHNKTLRELLSHQHCAIITWSNAELFIIPSGYIQLTPITH